MPAEFLEVNERIRIPAEELQFSFTRSGGPGGQNVNKVSTRAVLSWQVTESAALPGDVQARFLQKYSSRISAAGVLQLACSEYRTQQRNIEGCRQRLAALIDAVAVAPVQRRPTRPTRGSQHRRLEEKRQQSARKQSRRRPGGGDY